MKSTLPRWRATSHGPYTLAGADGETQAEIGLIGSGTCIVKTRNRSGGWLYAYAKTLRGAKAKAKRMIEEEQK